MGLILGVIVINIAVGLLQEGKAEKAAEALQAMLSPTASVIRQGQRRTLPAEQLVLGDVVVLKAGDKVPADLRLMEANKLQVCWWLL
jgi:P-type E1-E2 ATPase